MLCENCGKKEATSIFLPPNEKKLTYLCGACYRLKNSDVELEKFAYSEVSAVEIDSVCNKCNTTFKAFQKNGLFGCENCYNAFKNHIKTKFITMFKEQKYLGRKPNLFYVQEEIKNLEQLIEMCVKSGNLQKAANYGRELEKLKEESYGKL